MIWPSGSIVPMEPSGPKRFCWTPRRRKWTTLVDRYRDELRRSATFKWRPCNSARRRCALSACDRVFLINMITKGYFTLRLQLIAGTITAVALLVLLGGP